jgi:UbiD family decarboxylase
VIKVRAITHRSDAIYQDLVPGDSSEHLTLVSIGHASQIFNAVKRVVPTIKAVNMPVSGKCHHCYISIRKTADGQAYQAILTTLGVDFLVKLVVVVDDDVDVFDETEVLAALACRMQADEDLIVIPNTMATILDPSAKEVLGGQDAVGAKVGIDATKPLLGFPERCRVPKSVVNKIKDQIEKVLLH